MLPEGCSGPSLTSSFCVKSLTERTPPVTNRLRIMRRSAEGGGSAVKLKVIGVENGRMTFQNESGSLKEGDIETAADTLGFGIGMLLDNTVNIRGGL